MANPLPASPLRDWCAHAVMTERDARRFWSKVSLPTTPGACMPWTAYRDRRGYGKINMGGRRGRVEFAHRISYRALIGDIPDHLVLDHLCRNPSCVRPDHLEPVTPRENVQRGVGGQHHASKTHCPAGHPYEGANLYVRTLPSGTKNRICRSCKNARERTRRAAGKAGAA